jgi:hypothetical protein
MKPYDSSIGLNMGEYAGKKSKFLPLCSTNAYNKLSTITIAVIVNKHVPEVQQNDEKMHYPK